MSRVPEPADVTLGGVGTRSSVSLGTVTYTDDKNQANSSSKWKKNEKMKKKNEQMKKKKIFFLEKKKKRKEKNTEKKNTHTQKSLFMKLCNENVMKYNYLVLTV